jgi:hypothetical protein
MLSPSERREKMGLRVDGELSYKGLNKTKEIKKRSTL